MEGGETERGSVAGIELLTRTSLNSLRDANQVSNSYLWHTLKPTADDRNWSWTYLRHQFRLKDLEKLYLQYQHQLHKGFYSVFLASQIIITLGHISSILIASKMEELWRSIPDLVGYSVVPVGAVLLAALIHRGPGGCAAVIATALITASDLLPTLVHAPMSLRPARPAITLLSLYTLLPLSRCRHAIALAATTTVLYLTIIAIFTHSGNPIQTRLTLIAAEFLFLFCINLLGLYFRFINEVVVRRTFLDRRACVESTLRLNYEKEQEEQLMLSILPRHISSRVKADIRHVFQQIKTHHEAPLKQKPFRELYVEEHENVTILYADVVNFSKLTVSLHPRRLVETLNELFTRFDEASDYHGVLRIKFLGDCYYCVSGVPQPNKKHAESCVDLALDMISIIKEVREERQLDVDMRIGVHSGKILSGVLGVCKWQYDIWSRDVMIANHMEQTGRPGKVHVTKQTLEFLGNSYAWERGDGALRDPFLAQYLVDTYFIIGKHQGNYKVTPPNEICRKDSLGNTYRRVRRPYDPSRHTMFMENNLILYQQMLRRADECMEKAIKQMPFGNCRSWKSMQDINPICLTFEKIAWEVPFLCQPDPLFKFYIAASLIVLLLIRAIQAIHTTSTSTLVWICFAVAAVVLLFTLPLTWTHFIWNRFRDPHQEIDLIPEPDFKPIRLLYRASVRIIWSNSIRTFLYIIVSFLLAASALLHVMECDHTENVSLFDPNGNTTYSERSKTIEDCPAPWHITQTCSLAMIMSFLFLRIHFQLKLMVGCLMVVAHSFAVWNSHPVLFQDGATWNVALSPQISHTLSMVSLLIMLHLQDRQAEYMIRLDYRWKRQLAEEQEEASTTRTVNKMLLQNILPMHVADLYLNTSRPHEGLYHEQYDSVAVMFATLIETTLDGALDNERSSLEVINYIICGFDKLLLEASDQKIEKIKVAGRTYMAACGLEPGRRDSSCLAVHSEHYVVILVRFAVHMMKLLERYNLNNNFKFQLTVGIAHGAVAAGVVGSQKPLYDIWGDAVNLASRMDSTGIPGRIQVPEETSKVLEKCGVPCDERGMTHIKGKGDMVTYLVSEKYKLQVATPIMSSHNTIEVTKL